MIDPRIKNGAILVAVLVVALPILSVVWNKWMAATQQDMIDNQIKMRAHAQGLVREAHANQITARIREKCDAVLESDSCLAPNSISRVDDCLLELSMRQCDSLPDMNLCAIVEQIKICADPFEDQRRNGCSRLRQIANCSEKPAPDGRAGLWPVHPHSS